MALFRFIWLIPAIPLVLAFWAVRRSFSDITQFLLENWQGSVFYALAVGIIFWLVTVYVQLRPSLTRKGHELYINKYGLLASPVEITNIKEIKVHSLGPIGTLLDFRMKTNLSFREFIFLGKARSDLLSNYLSGSEIRIT